VVEHLATDPETMGSNPAWFQHLDKMIEKKVSIKKYFAEWHLQQKHIAERPITECHLAE